MQLKHGCIRQCASWRTKQNQKVGAVLWVSVSLSQQGRRSAPGVLLVLYLVPSFWDGYSCIAWKLKALFFFFVSLLFCYKHKILSERCISSPLALQFFAHFRCRQAGVWVGSFWPYFSIGHGLQLCFPYLWLELITAASTMHEREESWRYLSAVVETKWENRQKRTELLFEADGCWVNSFATC